MLFEHALLDLTALINKLLLALYLSAHNVEFRVLFAEGIVGHFKSLVEFALHEGLTLFFTLTLEGLEAFKHGLAHLLGGLLFFVEFMLVHAVFVGEEGSESISTGLEISAVCNSHAFKTALHYLLNDDFVGLVLPLGSECKILMTVDVGKVLLQFLNKMTSKMVKLPLTNSVSRRAWICASALNF